MKPKTTSAYKKFGELINTLIRVSHAEVKAKLEAEKQAKKRKRI